MEVSPALSCCGINELSRLDEDISWKSLITKKACKGAIMGAIRQEGISCLPSIAYTIDHRYAIYENLTGVSWKEINRVLKTAGFKEKHKWYNPSEGNHLIMWFFAPKAKKKVKRKKR